MHIQTDAGECLSCVHCLLLPNSRVTALSIWGMCWRRGIRDRKGTGIEKQEPVAVFENPGSAKFHQDEVDAF